MGPKWLKLASGELAGPGDMDEWFVRSALQQTKRGIGLGYGGAVLLVGPRMPPQVSNDGGGEMHTNPWDCVTGDKTQRVWAGGQEAGTPWLQPPQWKERLEEHLDLGDQEPLDPTLGPALDASTNG